MVAVAPAQQNGMTRANGSPAIEAVALSLEEGLHQKKQLPAAVPAQPNGFAHTNGVANGLPNGVLDGLPNGTANGEAPGDHVVISLDESRPRPYAQHTTMWGTHHFGERTHAGVQQRHYRAVKWLGKIGWIAKGIVYALIGGLCCRAAADGNADVDASPQGAFELLGSGRSGKIILLIEMGGVVLYVTWRFWEGITAQGSHPAYGAFKNFFTFRLSPIVSGFVYCAYLAFCATLVPKTWHNNAQNATNSDFTRSWHKYWYGNLGLALLGVAFTAACATQLIAVLTNKINHDLKANLNKWIWWPTVVSGHIGSAGRAGFFLLVAILMFRSVVRDQGLRTNNTTTFGNALQSLRGHRWGRTILFFIGFGLVVYGLYCTLIAFFARVFPTPGPTDEEVKELEVKNEQKAAARAVKNAQKATGRNEAKERRKANKVAHQYGSRPSLAATLHLPFGKK